MHDLPLTAYAAPASSHSSGGGAYQAPDPAFATVKLFDLCAAPERMRRSAVDLAGRDVTPLDAVLVFEVTVGRYDFANDPLQDEAEAALAAEERHLHAWLRANGAEEGETVVVRLEPC